MGWLDGEVALVTGGGSGIGRAVVERYVEAYFDISQETNTESGEPPGELKITTRT